jgi:anaerobic selenocysteine-containing dehydrogenase
VDDFSGTIEPDEPVLIEALIPEFTVETLDALEGYNLHLITCRTILHTKSRTIGNYWLTQIEPENFVTVNSGDASQLGIREGDSVQVSSHSNPDGVWDLKNGVNKPMVGKVKITEGMRPGVISFTLGMGHWAAGSSDVTVDGNVVKGDPRRSRGIHANAAMRLDDHLKNTCMVDPVGGSVSFYDTKSPSTKPASSRDRAKSPWPRPQGRNARRRSHRYFEHVSTRERRPRALQPVAAEAGLVDGL